MGNFSFNSSKQDLSESRSQIDRRNRVFQSFLYSLVKRRRKAMRRANDFPANVYVDKHDPITVLLFSAVLIFCVADALLTLLIIQAGGEELNPFMKSLMDDDVMLFFWVKFSVTSIGMLFLVSHKFFIFYRKIRGIHIIKTVFAAYFTLVVYELILISNFIAGPV